MKSLPACVVTVAIATTGLFAQDRGPGPTPRAQEATALDLAGKGAQARELWQKEVLAAANAAAKAAAERNLAMSWAFSGNCANTAAYEQRAIAYWKTQEEAAPANAFYQEGEVADEAARVCIDLGDLGRAAALYKRGYEAGLREPHLAAGRRDLWEYRYEHALARLAARRGDRTGAAEEVAAARGTLARMQRDDKQLYRQQVAFFPYLQGYVAFYAGDTHAALVDFQQDQRQDPFITAMIGLCYEKLGDSAKARVAFVTAAKTRSHNPPSAFAHREARLEGLDP